MSYNVIGISPPGDLSKSVEKLLADYLKAVYDQSITSIPVNSIRWEQYGITQGDYAIYFQSTGDFDVSTEVSNSLFETDHFTEMHVFARSLHDDYERSGLKQLFLIEKWVKKALRQGRLGLQDKGLAAIYYRDTRHVPTEDDTNDIHRIVITIQSKILTVNNDNLV